MSEERVELAMEALLLGAERASPSDRKKLKGILKKYAKSPHPFRACMRDNEKRFGPERAARVCATLKDIIRGTTKWRGNKKKDKGAPGVKNLQVDDTLAILLESISDEAIDNANRILLGE